MRLTDNQVQTIKQVVAMLAGEDAKVTLFGSRVDDTKKGGDIDLLITLNNVIEHPAVLSSKISARLIRLFQGRKVDVLLSAPNLKSLPIHQIAQNKGVLL
ncbi:nucleotidyltransferase domain-containing protein [Marinomonas sp. M1K-6]|uniref:Nucleotidyltransferase domain-containing protein n=1 Tax=Marinomonas profundi TaxID=2726122 RepID=A0A847R4P0_9GAMM|nr:nucleotidyltransferase domain-containing protein [Marinomonas profundi]NLQ18965.1 nucleotidyltransferase domain-containing protein [Marinomonas profundi]UDV04203.1 nucleotidyltransferase domain-containing protein [Marinomonas profundi]